MVKFVSKRLLTPQLIAAGIIQLNSGSTYYSSAYLELPSVFIPFTISSSLKIKFMDPSFFKVDFVARCVDNAVYIGLGVAVFLIVPRQIRRKLESGKLTEAKAKSLSKVVLPFGCLLIGYGIFRIFAG